MLFLAAIVIAPLSAHAATFEGTWSIEATTDVGNCEKTVQATVTVTGRDIVATDASGVAVVGIVEGNGEIWSRFTRGDHVARAQGRLSGTKGSGSWSSGSAYCGGRWRAEKLK